MGKGDGKDFSLSLEMTMRKNGILPPSLGRRCPEGAEVGFRYSLKRNVRYAFPSIAILTFFA